MSDSSFTPQVIPNTPIPLLNSDTSGSVSGLPQSSGIESQDGLAPTTIGNQPTKDAPIASDVIGTSIDTSTRRILGAYSFGQVGALEVGSFQQGVTGDVRITPVGIIGRNNQGSQTFSLDDQGELILRSGNNVALLDGTGLISTSNFNSNEVFNGASALSTSSASFADVAGSSLSAFTPTRTVNLLFFLMIYGYNDSAITSNLANNLEVQIYDSFLGGSVGNIFCSGATSTYTPDGIIFTMTVGDLMLSRVGIVQVGAGTHNYKLRYRVNGGGNGKLDAWDFGYTLLGS